MSSIFKELCVVIAVKVNCSYKIRKSPSMLNLSSIRFIMSEKYYCIAYIDIFLYNHLYVESLIDVYINRHVFSYLKVGAQCMKFVH